jgi:hypothetical protein
VGFGLVLFLIARDPREALDSTSYDDNGDA